MVMTPGTRLGPYEIIAPLGAGGMGEVYRARDTRLGREVAIKVLPDALAADAERIARFEREAKVLASLSHHNIAALFGMDEADGRHFLIRELVEGETLAERIGKGRGAAARRGAAHREADRRRARSGTRAGDHPSRSQARQHQGLPGRDGEGPRLRAGEGHRPLRRIECERDELADALHTPRRPGSSSARPPEGEGSPKVDGARDREI